MRADAEDRPFGWSTLQKAHTYANSPESDAADRTAAEHYVKAMG